mmetsp:Transcript_1051/g.1734  ORF Transcript_1051/g.1734 Transcript_1051/m.1734 type:complete len:92 (+) Transcript_1051:2080-2355(+)
MINSSSSSSREIYGASFVLMLLPSLLCRFRPRTPSLIPMYVYQYHTVPGSRGEDVVGSPMVSVDSAAPGHALLWTLTGNVFAVQLTQWYSS